MKKIARISTAAFLAGATTLAVTLPMPSSARSGVAVQRIAELPVASEAQTDEQDLG